MTLIGRQIKIYIAIIKHVKIVLIQFHSDTPRGRKLRHSSVFKMML